VFQTLTSWPGIVLCAVCFAGGINLLLFRGTEAHSISPKTDVSSIPASQSGEAISQQPEITFTLDEAFPTPDAFATDEELLVLARKAVARSPQSAIAWARRQYDSLLSRRVLFAVIQAWGESDPEAALDWVLMQDDDERRTDMDAALAGAATKQPQLALSIVRGLLKYDPADGNYASPSLVAALNNAGQFQTALEFINDGPLDSRADWLKATFARWAQSQPQAAAEALAFIPDDELRAQTFQALANGWATSDPSALANYATSLPDGQSRTYALNKAVENWSLQDPAAMATWLATSPAGVDFDQAIATLISKTDSMNRSPQVAMQWVENISDPNLKYDSMKLVLGQWKQTDAAAAQNYAANVSWIDEQKRQELVKVLQSPPPNLVADDDE